MSSPSELLLLVQNYKNNPTRGKNHLPITVSDETKAILEVVSAKLDNYAENKVTRTCLIRALLSFSIDALGLLEMAASAEPLAITHEKSLPRREINALSEFSDIVNLEKNSLTSVEQVHLGGVIDFE